MTKIAICIIALCLLGGGLFGLLMEFGEPETAFSSNRVDVMEPPPPLIAEASESIHAGISSVDARETDATLEKYLRLRQNVVVAKHQISRGKKISPSDVELKSVNYFPVYPFTRIKEVVGRTIARDNIPRWTILTTELLEQVQ